MSAPSISPQEFTNLRQYIEESCGISVGDEKTYLVESRLRGLLEEINVETFGELYQRAKYDATSNLRDRLVDAMTTNETLWFRDTPQFAHLGLKIFPPLINDVKTGRRKKIRIWSAACATGQEPYSLAITFLEALKKFPGINPDCVEIVGSDICRSAIFTAMNGKYDQFAIGRGMPPRFATEYFTCEENIHTIKPEVKNMVRFKRLNLQDSFTGMGPFDIIFLRNVAIYFSDDFKRDLFDKLAGRLVPSGLFFLAASESIRGHSDRFKTMLEDRVTYYRLNK